MVKSTDEIVERLDTVGKKEPFTLTQCKGCHHRTIAHEEERAGIKRIANLPDNGISSLAELWEEQETGIGKETQLLKVVDRLPPFLLNIANEEERGENNRLNDHKLKTPMPLLLRLSQKFMHG